MMNKKKYLGGDCLFKLSKGGNLKQKSSGNPALDDDSYIEQKHCTILSCYELSLSLVRLLYFVDNFD